MSKRIPVISQKQVTAFLKPRPRDSHKGQFGTVAIIGGAAGMVGAPLLAARAALKMGAGAVHVGLLASNAPAVDMLQPELMLHNATDLLRSRPLPNPLPQAGEGANESLREFHVKSPSPLAPARSGSKLHSDFLSTEVDERSYVPAESGSKAARSGETGEGLVRPESPSPLVSPWSLRSGGNPAGTLLAGAGEGLGRGEEELASLRQLLAATQAELAAIKASHSWRITAPLRKMADLVRRLVRGRQPASPAAAEVADTTRFVVKPHYSLRDRWYDAQHPDVSLIVLNFNKPDMTLACLDSLWEHTQGYRYEIVLVDNGSEVKNFRELAPAQAGARIVRLDVNRFFGEGNNIGFEAARGRYVVFLNNDITATAGWLAPLIQRLANDPGIGAAGPKMVSPDYRLQEAGAEIRADGSDNRYGRGADPDDPAYATQRDVMYISAAALAMRRETFEQVLGFDLYYEPAYYEDCDLCLKIGQINLRVTYCPDSCIVHHENVTSGEYAGQLKLDTLIPLNRARFLARWRPVLAGEASTVPGLIPPLAPPLQQRDGLPSVLLYTPYNLVPGGGERYLLTIAAGLAEVANVTLATLHPYSRLRLRTMGRELSLNLDAVRIATLDQAANSATYEASIVMGNEALPGIPGQGKHNIYLCQFPFPVPQQVLNDRRKYADDYEQVMVYSPFVQRHYARALQALGRPLPKIAVVSPPAVLAPSPQGGTKKAMVLGVGRFINAGHAKRHDLMIEAFRELVALRPDAELHLAGSLPAEGEFRAYFADLQHKAEGLQVFFHPNVSPQRLAQLYADASLYWHLTGYGVDEASEPHRCEHFGITVVEAMSAGCIPLVVNRGGPPETVQNGVTGYVFESLDELVEISARILSLPSNDAGIVAMRAAAIEASSQFSPEHFIAEIRDLMGFPLGHPATSSHAS